MSTTIIIFSKDRPFQLKEYLRSLRLYVKGFSSVKVLWQSTAYRNEYLHLIEQNVDQISFIEQGDSFLKSLSSILNSVETTHILFNVDDLIWYRDADLTVGELFLNNFSTVFGYSFRLHSGIKYCQPAKLYNRLPILRPIDNLGYEFDTRDGTVDFAYLGEISCCMYRSGEVRTLLTAAIENFGGAFIKTPNHLEDCFVRLVSNQHIYSTSTYGKPCCSILTVNRVQEDYQNAVYNEISLEQLNGYYWTDRQLDLEWYSQQSFDRIHIGNIVFKDNING